MAQVELAVTLNSYFEELVGQKSKEFTRDIAFILVSNVNLTVV